VNGIVEAGARVILKRAVTEIGATLPPDIPTASLAKIIKIADAPVHVIIERWRIMADAKPGLTEKQRELMRAQADRALEIMAQTEGTRI
jgi:hypothetical protein